MLSIVYADCRILALYTKCRYAECHYAECRYAECHYTDCRYAECHFAECRGAKCRIQKDPKMYIRIFHLLSS